MEHIAPVSNEALAMQAEELVFKSLQRAFPNFVVMRQVPIVSRSGNRVRQTVMDLVLENSAKQRLYIEITLGSAHTLHKRRQKKTARLAGIGQQRLTLDGDDLVKIQHAAEIQKDGELADTLRLIFRGRFNAKLFRFEI